jgi:hypothetical protein
MMLAEHDEAKPRATPRRSSTTRSYNNMVRDLLPAIELGGNALA